MGSKWMVNIRCWLPVLLITQVLAVLFILEPLHKSITLKSLTNTLPMNHTLAWQTSGESNREILTNVSTPLQKVTQDQPKAEDAHTPVSQAVRLSMLEYIVPSPFHTVNGTHIMKIISDLNETRLDFKSNLNYFTNKSLVGYFDDEFHLKLIKNSHFFTSDASLSNVSHVCLSEGVVGGERRGPGPCVCREGWYGPHCSIPPTAFRSLPNKIRSNISIRTEHSRRIIMTFAFNMEFDMLEIRLNELRDLVDVFVILESNYTMYGDPKQMPLLAAMVQGYLKDFHSQMLYVFDGQFPANGKYDGWIADNSKFTLLGKAVMKHVHGLKPDDIFMYFDADEIPSRESLLFLKLHDGYPEPIGVSLQWSMYGFFWQNSRRWTIKIGCTIAMLRHVYHNDGKYVRKDFNYDTIVKQREAKYHQVAWWPVQLWYLGDNGGTPAGWHCSWCFRPRGIRTKLVSAFNADFPRWGDYLEKLDLGYISELVQEGWWFDDTHTRIGQLADTTMEGFAPIYALHHKDRFDHLLHRVNKTS